jgi:O-antigen ligase
MTAAQLLKIILFVSTAFPSGIGVVAADIPFTSSKLALLLITLVIFVLLFSRGQLTFFINKFDKYVILFGFIIALCSAAAGINNKASIGNSIAFSITALVWFYSYFSVYFLARTISFNIDDIKNIEHFLINLLIICAIIGIIEYIFKINFYGKIAAAIGLKDTGGVTTILLRGDQVRARSSFDQSIALGFAMIIGIILVEKNNQQSTVLSKIKIGIFILGMALSFSRSSLAIYILYLTYRTFTSSGIFKRLLILLVFFAGAIYLVEKIDTIFYIDDSLDAGDGNLLVRFRDFEFVGYCLDDVPLFGIGAGLLHNNQLFERLYPDLFSFYDGALDNMFLGILVEYGIIGLAGYILFFYMIFKIRTIANNLKQRQIAIGLLMVGAGASLSYDLFVFPGVGRLYLAVLGLYISELYLIKN